MKSGDVLLGAERTSLAGRRNCAVLHAGLSAVLLAALVTGCGGPSGHKVVPVSGTVTIDGQAAERIHVAFTPLAEGKVEVGPGSAAVADAQGRFTLQTTEQSRRPGAVAGKHSVIFSFPTAQAPDDDSIPSNPEQKLPKRYWDGSETFEVPATGTDQADFDLKTQSP